MLRHQGKILYVGSSNFAGWHIAQAQEAAARRHFMGLVSEQSHLQPAARQIELEVLPAAEHYGLGVIPWSPLTSGLLGGILRKERDGSRRYGACERTLEADRAESRRMRTSVPSPARSRAVALAWLLSRPAVTAPIIGPRTPSSSSRPCGPST